MIGPVCARKALFLSGAVPGMRGALQPPAKPVKAEKTEKVEKQEKPAKGQREGKEGKERKGESKPASGKKGKKAVPDGRPIPVAEPEKKIRWAGAGERMWAVRREAGSYHRG